MICQNMLFQVRFREKLNTHRVQLWNFFLFGTVFLMFLGFDPQDAFGKSIFCISFKPFSNSGSNSFLVSNKDISIKSCPCPWIVVKVEISQNFVAFSEYMNFMRQICWRICRFKYFFSQLVLTWEYFIYCYEWYFKRNFLLP